MLAFLNVRASGVGKTALFRAAVWAAYRCRRVERHSAAVRSFQAVAEALESAAASSVTPRAPGPPAIGGDALAGAEAPVEL